MSTQFHDHEWVEANQCYLSASMSVIKCSLQSYRSSLIDEEHDDDSVEAKLKAMEEAADDMPSPSALDILCDSFGLSPFERDILLLCAGVEMDTEFFSLCSALQGDRVTYPTFSLAMAGLPDPHWSAILPGAPLRYWRLIEVGNGSSLVTSHLRIDERILHYLAGLHCIDERLVSLTVPVKSNICISPSHVKIAQKIALAWTNTSRQPVIQLCGSETQEKKNVAGVASEYMGSLLRTVPASFIPDRPEELSEFVRLWEREAILNKLILLVDCDDLNMTDRTKENSIRYIVDNLECPVIVLTRDRWPGGERPVLFFTVNRPAVEEQFSLWIDMLGPMAAKLDGGLDHIVSQFNLTAQDIVDASQEALSIFEQQEESISAKDIKDMLWDACKSYTRPRLSNLSQRIEPVATWDDLVLPKQQIHMLENIAAHVRNRAKVYEEWGFAAKSTRGLGISALFAGASGTGKTMAAEVLANELRLDLYRIDLSQVVSKYIGETEKNLRQVFDAAEDGGAILLFDEADALFGKRSEVKDSHDRYANIEVSYLLQRMEAYRGLAILTTNMKNALDTAFMRRLRFIIEFPFPDMALRTEIWERTLPQKILNDDIVIEKLAQLNVTGGSIRNIALNAAFMAAEDKKLVQMSHMIRAARMEYYKLEKPLTDAEIRGWA